MYAAALDGKAPKFLLWERWGVPYFCVLATSAMGLLSYLNLSSSASEVFFWISNLSSVSTLLVWSSISITYLRFHAGLAYNNIPRSSLPWAAPFQPYLAWFSLCFCSVVALFNGFDCFFPGRFSAKTFVPPYINIPIFATLYFGYKIIKRTKIVRLAEMDLWSGKAEIDALEEYWVVPRPRNLLERVWFWIA
jgi:yeast amino acid transporter